MLKTLVSPVSNRAVNAQNLRFGKSSLYTEYFNGCGLPYGAYCDCENCRVSIDMLRFVFVFDDDIYDHSKQKAYPFLTYIPFLLESISYRNTVFETYWFHHDSFKIGTYSSVCRCSGVGWSCALMFGRYAFNGSKRTIPEAVLEFNPNKCPADFIDSIFSLFLPCCNELKITRFDVAIDIPLERSSLYMLPSPYGNNRTFDDTQYYGKRHSHNSVKFYNKSVESHLLCPITRLEITYESSKFQGVQASFPTIYSFSGLNMDFSFYSLPFEVQSCILFPDLLPVLKRSSSPNSYRKYKRLIDDFPQYRFFPSNMENVNNFVCAVLGAYLGGKYEIFV